MIFLYGVYALPILKTVLGECYAPGPAWPTVDRILDTDNFVAIGEKFDDLISTVLAGPDGWNTSTTSFAIQITTRDETIWERYHTAPLLGKYMDSEPSVVSGDTAFRVASVSKSFTAYAILLEKNIALDDPITKWLPELMEGEKGLSFVQWDQISIRFLMNQLSGIQRGTGLSDLVANKELWPDFIQTKEDFAAYGFPPVDENLRVPCMKNIDDRPCQGSGSHPVHADICAEIKLTIATEIITVARSRPKVFEPNARSTYSNAGFSLLGQVLERATNRSFSDIIASSILIPLGMNHTGTSKPKDTEGIIPYGHQAWAIDLGADTPSGGIYCTSNDFSKYLRSILAARLLPQAVINSWMKPHSWTGGTHSAYGMPWEMLRSTILTPDGRGIDFVTKGGSLPGYYSSIALIPEFGFGISLLIAGDFAALMDLLEKVHSEIVSTTEVQLRKAARQIYAGQWSAAENLSYPSNWSLTLEVDDNGPGILITDWISNGTQFLPVYGRLKGMPYDGSKWEARLLPTGVYRDVGDTSTKLWRLTAIPKRGKKSSRLYDDFCMTDADTLIFSGKSIDEFEIIKKDKEAGVLHISGMRTRMFKRKSNEYNSRYQNPSQYPVQENQQLPMS
ncbi:hypothetical protein BP5796_06632 [Coleophoma crateriformis]|uniref:Uncharacterized protein n=1 Tax=Coleophoma crateriformis TaxID=565419 RepID=A0A3D8RPT1_9HELO|nr:hypothetical protein BP5796_06632 [Coleophoma crateriformis]